MPISLAWKIGGDQGEGIDSTGDVIATVGNRLGYYVYGYKSFSSRIKGGHTHYKVRLAAEPVLAPTAVTHMLVALNQETIDKNGHEVVPGGAVVADESFQPKLPPELDATLVTLPMTAIAREIGNPLVRNMVAVGATSALLNLPLEAFRDYVSEKFQRKGASVVAQNVAALKAGYERARAAFPEGLRFRLPEGDRRPRLVLTGNEAVALGALAAGCRIMAGYPITPASDIMETLVRLFPRYGGVVCQMEDEIAAITLVIGAGYAGARAMTATAGPGLSLMQEGLGLASAAEVPVVLVDCQRAGPSTGMPTKEEQSDIFALIFGGHGEGQRIVLAPGTVTEAYEDAILAFNLADRFHCPVIIASDLSLAQWKATAEDLPLERAVIDRGPMATAEDIARLEGKPFRRYEFTESGVSPRVLPGVPGGQYLATGVEHQPTGKVSEDPANRKAMMDKRAQKLAPLRHAPGTVYKGPERPELLVVSFGSTVGAVDEALAGLDVPGVAVGHLRVRRLWPLPVDELRAHIGAAKKVLFVEMNSTSQLRSLCRLEGIDPEGAESLLKYDGTLLLPEEVAAKVVAMLVGEVVGR
jgi:2-oxoglutarate ferredoxin oxidoreductase subunit alpha